MKELIKNYSFSTDIWSIGCIVFEMIRLESYYDFEKSNKISGAETFEVPYLEEAPYVLNKLLKMFVYKEYRIHFILNCFDTLKARKKAMNQYIIKLKLFFLFIF
jgi:serine/threonine protein kinase